MSKKVKILIIGSLLTNIFLIGFIIGDGLYLLRGKQFFSRYAAEFASKLPEEKANLLLETIEKAHLKNRDVHKQMRRTREKVMDILTAPQFNEAAYRIEVKNMHEFRSRMMHELADATLELANQLGQEERKALAEHLMHPPRQKEGIGPSHRWGGSPHNS